MGFEKEQPQMDSEEIQRRVEEGRVAMDYIKELKEKERGSSEMDRRDGQEAIRQALPAVLERFGFSLDDEDSFEKAYADADIIEKIADDEAWTVKTIRGAMKVLHEQAVKERREEAAKKMAR